jgi:hypothetical protein
MNTRTLQKFLVLTALLWIFFWIFGFVNTWVPSTGNAMFDTGIQFLVTISLPVFVIIKWKKTKSMVQ